MNETRDKAEQLVRSVLAEAYSGGTARVLAKYHLSDEAGNLRVVTVKYPPGDPNGEPRPGPIIMPDVIERFLALDPSNNKRVFDWMLFAAGGGEPHLRESERAIDLAKNWVIANRMKGEGRNDEKIKPMTRQEAEADWMANDYEKYRLAYFFADQDLAGDVQYPVFGWFRDWPGRKNVYEKVVQAVTKWMTFVKDKKFISNFNKTNPKEPFKLDLMTPEGVPVFKDAETLNAYVSDIKAKMARRRAEQNVVTVGKAPEGGYRTGPDEVLYADDNLQVVVPLTAAASLKKGFNDWCIANRSRWETYFNSREKGNLLWGGSSYTGKGPFAFLTFKQRLPDTQFYALTGRPQSEPRPQLAMLALHVQLDLNPNAPGRFVYWDMENRRAIPQSEIEQRIRSAVPNAMASFKTANKEVSDWLTHFKQDQLERFPPLESLARALAANLLND